jgi:hypothetical protein
MTCEHKAAWRSGQRSCLKCHAESQRGYRGASHKRRLRQRERYAKALELLEEARDMLHGEYCYGPREERVSCCVSCLEITDFLNQNPEPRTAKKEK